MLQIGNETPVCQLGGFIISCEYTGANENRRYVWRVRHETTEVEKLRANLGFGGYEHLVVYLDYLFAYLTAAEIYPGFLRTIEQWQVEHTGGTPRTSTIPEEVTWTTIAPIGTPS
jgi:hypothetical protein